METPREKMANTSYTTYLEQDINSESTKQNLLLPPKNSSKDASKIL